MLQSMGSQSCTHLKVKSLSRVRLFVTPWTVAYHAPPSMGFSRQEYWSGLPFPSPGSESESEVAQSCPTLCDPMDYGLPGFSVHGIFQARILEWVAISFSRGSSQPRDRTCISCMTGRSFNPSAIWQMKSISVFILRVSCMTPFGK